MPESADTCASVRSSDASSSPPDSYGAESAALRVDFYVLDEASGSGRMRIACRLAEKAYLAGQSVLIWHDSEEDLRALDDLLWTFMDGSFVPHDVLKAGAPAPAAPILLSAGTPPVQAVDLVVNLSAGLPDCLQSTRRVAEIIDGDEIRRTAGRQRFKAYRERSVQPSTHHVRGD